LTSRYLRVLLALALPQLGDHVDNDADEVSLGIADLDEYV
jgi:hypothetical protein